MNREYVLGIDCGTQSTKVVVLDLEGNVISIAREPIPVSRARPGWAEQNAEEWWTSLCAGLQSVTSQVGPASIRGLAVAYQRETFVPLDSSFRPLRPAILWMDQRAVSELVELRQVISDDRFRSITGKPLNPLPSIMKLKWIKNNEPDVWRATRRILTVGAYINHRLTGTISDSMAGADTTGLFDIQKQDWSDELLGVLGLQRDALFDVVPAGTAIGAIADSVARSTGLAPGTPVFTGGGDGQVLAVGVGAIHQSEMAVALGTSGICGVHVNQVDPHINFRAMAACIEGSYWYEGVIMSAANTVSWFVRNFESDVIAAASAGSESIEARLEREISTIPPCSDGLITIPYLRGCMTPYDDPFTRGATLGWSDSHTKAHMYKSILEGIAFEIKLIISAYQESSGVSITSLRIGGGGAASSIWSQIIADVTGVEVLVSATTENTASGAAVIAAVGLGLYESLDSATRNMCRKNDTYRPEQGASGQYNEFFNRIYRDVYPAIRKYLNYLGGVGL